MKFPLGWRNAARRALAIDQVCDPWSLGTDEAGHWVGTRFVAAAGLPRAMASSEDPHRDLAKMKALITKRSRPKLLGLKSKRDGSTTIRSLGDIYVQEKAVPLLRLCDELRVAQSKDLRVALGYLDRSLVAAVAEYLFPEESP